MSSSNLSRSIVLRLLQQHLHSSSSSCSSVPLAVALAPCTAHRIPQHSSSSYSTSDNTVGPRSSSSSWGCSSWRSGSRNRTGQPGHAVDPLASSHLHRTRCSSTQSINSCCIWGEQHAEHATVLQQPILAPQWPMSGVAAAGLLHSGASSGGSKGRCTAASSSWGMLTSSSSSWGMLATTTTTSSSSRRGISTSSAAALAAAPVKAAAVKAAAVKAAGDPAGQGGSSIESSVQEAYLRAVEEAKRAMEVHTFQAGQELDGGRYRLEVCCGFGRSGPSGCWQSQWLGIHLETGQRVLLKCTEAGNAARYSHDSSGLREAVLHAVLGSCSNIAGLRDAFEHRDRAGRHPVLVFEVPGATLAEVMRVCIPPPVDARNQHDARLQLHSIWDQPLILKNLARNLLTALDHLHSRGLVQMEVLPSRVVLDKPFESRVCHEDSPLWDDFKMWLKKRKDESVTIPKVWSEETLHRATFKLCGLSSAVTYANWHHPQTTDRLPAQATPAAAAAAAAGAGDVLTFRTARVAEKHGVLPMTSLKPSELDTFLHFLPPEAILEMPHIAPSFDMWQFGCLMLYAATGSLYFNSAFADSETVRELNYSREHWILSSMVERLGFMPRGYGRTSPKRAAFFHQGRGYDTWDYLLVHAGPWRPEAGQTPVYKFLMDETTLSEKHAKPFADFLNEVLCWQPSSRASARDLLQHPWLQDSSTGSED